MAVIIIINPMSWWYIVTSKPEMQILAEGTSYFGLVFSGKTSLEIASDGNVLAVQWLGLRASTTGGLGLIPGPGTQIPQAVQEKKKKKLLKAVQELGRWH